MIVRFPLDGRLYNAVMNLNTALNRLAQDPAATFDLAEIALLLARDEYPDLDVDGYLAELDAMAHELRRGLRGSLTARVDRLCHYLYHELGFHGNAVEYYDPRNSYFNEVLDRRLGIPISLSAVAMAIGQRAGLTIVGVALPGHFVVKATAGTQEILFDPFHGGRRLTVQDCATLVEQATGEPWDRAETALQPALLGTMVVRMLSNLKAIHLRSREFTRAVKVLKRLRQLQPDDPLQQARPGRYPAPCGPAGAGDRTPGDLPGWSRRRGRTGGRRKPAGPGPRRGRPLELRTFFRAAWAGCGRFHSFRSPGAVFGPRRAPVNESERMNESERIRSGVAISLRPGAYVPDIPFSRIPSRPRPR